MKLSCIVATYNSGSSLPTAIASLSGFDRVLVCDDGSTDNTQDVLIHAPVGFITISHSGMLAARNAAFDHLTFDHPDDEAIATFDADDVRNPVLASQQFLMNCYSLDVLLCPVTRNDRLLQLTGNPVLDVIGCNLHSSGIMARASLLQELRRRRGEVWRSRALCRSENWLLLDLLSLNPKVGYMASPVCEWRPGNFTRNVAAIDRLSEFERQACELRQMLGFRWCADYDRAIGNMAIALKYNAEVSRDRS